MNRLLRFLVVIAVVSAIVAVSLVVFDYFQSRGKFPYQTYIGAINVSGLDQHEAGLKLSAYKVAQLFSPLITFEAENFHFSFSPDNIGISLDQEKSVRNAFDLAHQDNYLQELKERLRQGAISSPPVLLLDEKFTRDVIAAIASEVGSSSRDATVVFAEQTGGYHIEAEELGREVNQAKTLAAFKERLAAGKKTFPLVIDYQHPRVTEKSLRAFPPVYRLAAYTTYYGKHDSPNRIHNIKLIASWLDGTILMPGENFSLANAIGEFTADRGFKEAYVIFGGVLIPQLGGGTCQIGTTLYNALSLADIKILQRANHSFYFNIYPLGRDATVYPGQKDLRVLNDTGHPVLIKAVATNKRLSFRIYGTPTGKRVEFTGPAVYLLTHSGYVPATVRQVLAADAPFRTMVIRTVYDNAGKKIKEEKISSSYKLYGEKSNVPIARPESR